MNNTRLSLVALCFAAAVLSACNEDSQPTLGYYQPNTTPVRLIVQCNADCAAAATDVVRLGGHISNRYSNVAALVVTVPADKVDALNGLVSIKGAVKDKTLDAPRPAERAVKLAQTGVATRPLAASDLADLKTKRPLNFLYNDIQTGAAALLERGITGNGIIVAVIDSGTANNPDVVPALADSVIGGENFVDFPDEPSATSTLNDSHGTMVGSMIAAHVAFVLPADSELVQSLLEHSPESVIDVSATEKAVPMLGTAPEANLYALKVFPADGGGTAGSIVLAAMDRAITLKKNFLDGMPSDPAGGTGTEDDPFVYDSLDIGVANLSLGGPSLFPGFEVDDLLALEMLKTGIVLTVAAGNEGPAPITGGSPGTSFGAISVGAAYDPIHRRVLADLEFGPGQGILFHPSDAVQIALFSSRGPTADGRNGIHLVANGVANFMQAANGDIAFASGTSFSAPTVAGGAALLRSAFPDAGAGAIRSALIRSANADVLPSHYKPTDRGTGYLDLATAFAQLEAGEVDDRIPEQPPTPRATRVASNIDDTGFSTISFNDRNQYTTEVTVAPGQAVPILVPSSLATGRLNVRVDRVEYELPPDRQNALIGDNLLVSIYDAPLSFNPIIAEEVVPDEFEVDIPNPQTGLVRVVLSGLAHNVGDIRARVRIQTAPRTLPRTVLRGRIADEELDIVQVRVRPGTTQATFELVWNMNWSMVPTHDIDLYVQDPVGNIILDPVFESPPGATLNSPERTVVDNPAPGVWTLFIDGYMLHDFEDSYRVYASDQRGRPIGLAFGD